MDPDQSQSHVDSDLLLKRRDYRGQINSESVKEAAALAIRFPRLEDELPDTQVTLDRIVVASLYMETDLRRRGFWQKHQYHLGTFTIDKILAYRKDLSHREELIEDEILENRTEKVWVKAQGELFIPDAAMTVPDLSLTFGPNNASRTGYIFSSKGLAGLKLTERS